MSEDMFEPSSEPSLEPASGLTPESNEPELEEEYFETDTYRIRSLYLVALLGGAIPIVVLGNRNASWLDVEKSKTAVLTILGLILMLARIAVTTLIPMKVIDFDQNYVLFIYEALCFLIFLGYYFVLRPNYKKHVAENGPITPLFKDGLLWIVTGVVIELALGIVLGMILGYIF